MITTTKTTPNVRDVDVLARRAPATDNLIELAAWLQANGSRHISPIECIELAEWLITRRRFLIGAGTLGLGVITGCGIQEEAAAPTATSAPTTRTLTTPMGDVTVPASPQRVVALHDTGVTYPLLDVGFRVIASAGSRAEVSVIRAGKNDVTDIQLIGKIREPNLEAIALLKPDLIIGLKSNDEPQYPQLTEIAPTVLLDYGADQSLFDIHRTVADVVNYGPQFEAMLERLDTRTAALKERLAPLLPTLEVSAFSLDTETTIFTYYGPGTPWNVAFERLGIQRSARMPASYDVSEKMTSLEELPSFDADVIYLMSYQGAEAVFGAVQSSPLFAALNAAKKNQVFNVDYDEWLYARVPGIEVVYDDIERTLLGQLIDTAGDFR